MEFPWETPRQAPFVARPDEPFSPLSEVSPPLGRACRMPIETVLARERSHLDPNTPELTRIFREEVDERTRRLLEGARLLAAGELAVYAVADLVRDAHTIKGSAGLLG